MRRLCTPLGEEVLELCAGDRVLLSGRVFTARDEAHERMHREGIPFDPLGAVVYHCGPVVQGERILAAGPTTSSRMDAFAPFLLERGIRAFIGKGGMGRTVGESLMGRGAYFAFTGGCAALAASRMRLCGVIWEELGMAEAIWILELSDLPLVVGMDAHGGDLFRAVRARAEEIFRSREA